MLKHIRDSIAVGLCSVLGHLLEDNSEDADKHLRLAKVKYGLGDFEGAIHDFDLAIKHDPSNTEALYWRSRTKYDAGHCSGRS